MMSGGQGSPTLMSNLPSARFAVERSGASPEDPPEHGATHATTVVRADAESRGAETDGLHPLLQAQLKELRLRTGSAAPDLRMLLRLVSGHYHSIDEERRGIVRSMQLMADEAQALARESREPRGLHDARGPHELPVLREPVEPRAAAAPRDPPELQSGQLQVILDHLKETVLTVDEHGAVRTFNPMGERVFGYGQDEVVGQPLDLLVPQIADRGDAAQGLARLAAATGDTWLDLAPREIWGRRKSGEVFPAEIAVSRARLGGRETFIVCMRDVTERRSAERHLRESEARYRMLVDHAPEAIVVVDAESSLFVDANQNAERLFGLSREELFKRGLPDVSPPCQPDGKPSIDAPRGYFKRALEGEPQRFEWVHCDASGRNFVCEVRLLSLPSSTRRLVRGSILDISERKRSERLRDCEREVLQQLASGAPLIEVLQSITRLVESVEAGGACSVSLLGPDGATFSTVVAPRLERSLHTALGRAIIGIRNGSCAAAVYLGRQVLVADVGKDPLWRHLREEALAAGVRAVWSMPIEAAGGKILGSLGVFRTEVGLPTEAESRIIAHAVQLAGIALERRSAEDARRHAEQAVFAEKERAQVTLKSIGDAVISTRADGLIEYLNPVAERLTGWKAGEARGRPLAEVVHLIDEGTRVAVADPARSLLARVGGIQPEHPVLVTRSGQEIAVQESAAPIYDAEGSAVGAVFVFRDVTQERHLKRALSYQATRDALTGLINRREFDHRLQRAVTRAQRGEGQYALLYIDLDQFKLVNDTCGHQAGDRLMRSITGLLRTRVRASDTIARLGGDEFGILLGECTLDHAVHIADGVRQAIHGYRFEWGSTTLSIGASVGVVEIKRETASSASLLSAADIACYAAKEAGRNRVHVYESSGLSSREREMHWAARITRAVEDDRLELYFQPIIPTAGSSAGAQPFHELMVRLRDEDGRLIMPGEFIPAAERYNVMPAIDRWVVRQATAILSRRLEQAGEAPLLAVNLSGNSLNDQSFLDFVLQQTADSAVARSLCFEITETAAVTSLSDATYFMQELRGRGCKFALDDFGSGLSSFMYLKTLPVDFLKIDGQFVTHVTSSSLDRSMVEAVGNIGRTLGIRTIAECVESREVLEELKRIGVDFLQGYFLGSPQPIAALPETVSPPR